MTKQRVGGLLLGAVLSMGAVALIQAQPALTPAPPAQEKQAVAEANELSVAFRHAARTSLPGVVSITARTAGHRIEQTANNPLEDEMLRRFLGDNLPQQFRNRSTPPQQGQGSGFVIDPSGIIMTNSHVVEGADTVVVHFQDGTELPAESWQSDPWSDVAIVRVKPDQPLKAIPLADSDTVEIGDWVLALGDPFGVGTSVTAGIISGKGRAPHINQREDFLQTDAAINPGNSGGPLVNLEGQVIGMNTAISTRSGGYDGVGFAVPITLARWVGDQLIQNGVVARPYLGVSAQPLTADLRRQFGVSHGSGALVAQVFPGSPSQKAGIKAGDVILDVNGTAVVNSISLQGIVERLKIGETYPVTVVRDGKHETIQVQMEQMPDRYSSMASADSTATPRPRTPESAASKSLGLEVSELTAENRESLGIGEEVQGVVVTGVDDNGAAAEKGVTRGDLIERVGTTNVSTVDEFNAAVSKAGNGGGVLLLLRQGQGTRFVVVTPKE